jgi:outer membrane protein
MQEMLLRNSSEFKQSQLQEKIAEVNLNQAYYALLPNLNMSVNNQNAMGLSFDQITGQLITGNQWANYGTATVSSGLVLFQGFREINTVRASRIGVDISKLDTEKLKQELQLQLLALFFQTLINADLYQASRTQMGLSEQQLNNEETKIEVGKGTLVDLAQSQNKLANDRLNVMNSKNAYDLSLLKLKQLLELDENVEIKLVPPREIERKLLFSTFPHGIPDNDPYVQWIDRRLDLADVDTRLARSGYYPALSLNSSYGTNFSSRRYTPLSTRVMSMSDQLNQNRSLYINVGITYAIFDKFTTRSVVRKSVMNRQNLEFEKDKIVRQRRQGLEQARLEYEAAQEEVTAVQVTYEANKVNYNALSERYEVGKSSSIDLYRAMTEYNVAEFRTITSKYSLMYKEEVLKLLMN